MFIIMMGISGCGKTTIGEKLAHTLNIPYYEGDAFHPPSNVEKMSHGIPLTDEDRKSWLAALAIVINAKINTGEKGVLACSALKEKYRDQLRVDPEKVQFIYLKGSYDLIYSRMKQRQGHYMPADLLRSQFKDLQEPDDIFTVNIKQTPGEILAEILSFLSTIRS
ncbi:MAG: gluconokinase [Chloroflexota bacterium]|nr:gluconokinase [Chloroflexota bacterium]